MMSYNRSIRFLLSLSVLCASGAYAQPLSPSPSNVPSAAANVGAVSVPSPSGVAPDAMPAQPLATGNAPQSIQSVAQGLINNALGTPDGRAFSYGTSNTSILFLPDHISRMKEAVADYERENRNASAATLVAPDATMDQTVQAPNPDEPVSYPVFFLSSIVYNSPRDWSLWMGGEKITSDKNETEVEVISVKRDSATFRWKPAYASAIGHRQAMKAFAATDSVKNKLSASHPVSYDEQSGEITFTLRQNQSFAVGYFKLFEGYVSSPTMEPIPMASMPTDESIAGAPSQSPAIMAPPRARPPTSPVQTPPNMRRPPNMGRPLQ